MTPTQALEELEKKIPAGTALTSALAQFVKFYEDTEIDGCPKSSDGDMLLFEWGGPYSWDESVSVSLTRQFSVNDENGDDDRMQQLHMHCRYDATKVALASGNEWLHGQDTGAFLQWVLDAPCTKTVESLAMDSLSFDLHDV
jgi:hypothetical protein